MIIKYGNDGQLFIIEKTMFRSVFANNSVLKVSTENDNNFGYEKNTIVVDNMPLTSKNRDGGVLFFKNLFPYL
jgi:hypothetical protein